MCCIARVQLELHLLSLKEAPTEPFFRPPPTARFRIMSSGFSGGALPIRVTPKTGAGSSRPCSEPESEKSTRQGLIRAGSREVDHSPANAPAEHVRHQNRINRVQRHEQRWPPITPLSRRGERVNGPLCRRGRRKTRHARFRFCDTCELSGYCGLRSYTQAYTNTKHTHTHTHNTHTHTHTHTHKVIQTHTKTNT